jgi:hypothetical protein
VSDLIAVLAAATVLSIGPGAGAASTDCHGTGATQLFLRHGIHTVRVERLGCRRAVRTLRRWSNHGMPGAGPGGWRCRARRVHAVQRVRCSRSGGRRMRFRVGGG